MSLLPFCVCKACRKWETWVSTIGRQEKEAGETNFCASSAKGIAKCSQFVTHNWLRAFRAEGRSCVFLRGPRSLSDPTSSLKAHRQSDRGVARLSFSCKRVKDPLYPQNVLSVRAFSSCSTPPSLPTYSLLGTLCWLYSVARYFCNCLAAANEIWTGEHICCFTKTSLTDSASALSEEQPVRKNCPTGSGVHKRLISVANASCNPAM